MVLPLFLLLAFNCITIKGASNAVARNLMSHYCHFVVKKVHLSIVTSSVFVINVLYSKSIYLRLLFRINTKTSKKYDLLIVDINIADWWLYFHSSINNAHVIRVICKFEANIVLFHILMRVLFVRNEFIRNRVLAPIIVLAISNEKLSLHKNVVLL